MSKHKFDSKEYAIIERDKNSIRFFNPSDSCLYQIQKNSQEDIDSKKGDLSLWNVSRDKRVSGLYLSKSKGITKTYIFDFMDQVYYLEITEDSVLIQFLHNKHYGSKQPRNSHKSGKMLSVGLW
jgi:hypothetical protein